MQSTNEVAKALCRRTARLTACSRRENLRPQQLKRKMVTRDHLQPPKRKSRQIARARPRAALGPPLQGVLSL